MVWACTFGSHGLKPPECLKIHAAFSQEEKNTVQFKNGRMKIKHKQVLKKKVLTTNQITRDLQFHMYFSFLSPVAIYNK